MSAVEKAEVLVKVTSSSMLFDVNYFCRLCRLFLPVFFLLSGLVKCEACKMPLTGRFAKSGQYSYYVCQSNINFGKDACNTPTLNARRFEELVVAKIRSNVLTKGNIRELVKVVAEEMDGVTREQRKKLWAIEDELEDVKKKLGRIWRHIRDDRYRHGRRLGPHQRASGSARAA